MAHVFGISNHSPDQVLSFLVRRKVIEDMSDVAIVPAGTRLREGAKPVRDTLFVITLSDMYSNIGIFNSDVYSATRVFVFASALKLKSVSGMVPMDYAENPEVSGVAFLYTPDLDYQSFSRAIKKTSSRLVHTSIDYLNTLSTGAKNGSLLNPLMTFIYSLPSHAQSSVKERVAEYIVTGTVGRKKLLASISRALSVPFTEKQSSRLIDILGSDICGVFMSAFVSMRSDWDSKNEAVLHSICKTSSISAYEMRYLRSISVKSGTAVKSTVEVKSNGSYKAF